jgi:predicted acylesterase/phospholipase RssA
MAAAPRVPRRSLLLAGGGMKVALQAGVMQVWLDEAGIKFDHVDGASGGCLNLAMYCQGMSGARIADNWRTLHPTAGVSVNWLQLQKLMFAKSLFTLDGYRKNVFPKWGLDWAAIRASAANATFNLYNFTKHQLEILGPELMDEDRLCSCISLPIWFPPIVLNGDNYIDAVYVTDANLEEAIRQGADELWVIWTVSTRGEWSNGFVNNYFQIIEASANGRLQQITDRVEANNLALSNGQPGEFGRPIELKVISAEVELNYLLNFTPDRVVEAVNRGVQVARQWCAENGVSLTGGAAASAPAAAPSAPISLEFSEVMRGFVTVGETDYDKGFRSGKIANKSLVVKLTIKTDDLNHFITFPQHEAEVTGSIISAQYGGVRPVIHGVFNLLVDTENPERKAMYYRLFFTDAQNNPLTLLGFKDVRNDNNSDPWTDTTTLFTRVLRGHVDPQADGGAAVVAAGIITIHLLDFMHQLTTFKLGGSSAPERAAAFARFGALFLGKLWDVYAHQILPESPF